jgi:hypothetical protein
MERIGRADKAERLLKECFGHALLTPETRRLAEAAFDRLKVKGEPGG